MILLWQFNDNQHDIRKEILMRFILSILTLLILIPLTSMAQPAEEPKPPKALADMQSTGAQIFYLGEFEGMNGWALIRQGKPEFFYENESRTGMVMGLMFNEAGEMITMAQLKTLNDRIGDDMYASTGGALTPAQKLGEVEPEPTQPATNNESSVVATTPATAAPAPINRPLTAAEKMYADLLSANWVTINPQGSQDIFAFIDPDCPHCKTFINDAAPYLVQGGIRIRAIPMGARDESMRKAAVLISSANPAERLVKYAAGDTSLLTAPDNINTAAAEKNMSLMIKHGFDVTPIIVYRTGKGEIRMIRGRPASMDTIINDIVHN